MENSKFERGQVYYLRFDGSIGDEMAVGRPVVIVSNNNDIEEMGTVIVAYMTTGLRKSKNVCGLYFYGKKQYVHCSQLQTVAKERLVEHMGKMSDKDMARITKHLSGALGIDEAEVVETEVEIEETKVEVEETEVEVSLRMERDMYKALYERALGDLVKSRFDKDTKLDEDKILELIDELPKNPPIQRRQKVVEVLYNAKREDIVGYRNPSGVTNVNTDPWYVIAATTGMRLLTAQAIVAHRNKIGKYKSLNDLVGVRGFSEGMLGKYRLMLEV